MLHLRSILFPEKRRESFSTHRPRLQDLGRHRTKQSQTCERAALGAAPTGCAGATHPLCLHTHFPCTHSQPMRLCGIITDACPGWGSNTRISLIHPIPTRFRFRSLSIDSSVPTHHRQDNKSQTQTKPDHRSVPRRSAKVDGSECRQAAAYLCHRPAASEDSQRLWPAS